MRPYPDFVHARGGMRGLTMTQLGRWGGRLGLWRRWQRVEWDRVERIIVLCMGNVCRSPYAEARMRQLGLNAVSAGLDVQRCASADPLALAEAAKRGLDLHAHRSRPLAELTQQTTDLLLVMEPAHIRTLFEEHAAVAGQTGLIGLWASPLTPWVFDPLGRSSLYFSRCYDILDTACRRIAGCVSRPAA